MRTIGMNHGGSKAVRCSRHSQLDTKVKWVRLGPAVYESLGVWALVKTLAAPCLPAVRVTPRHCWCSSGCVPRSTTQLDYDSPVTLRV